jgi:membrane AbrB-like protein
MPQRFKTFTAGLPLPTIAGTFALGGAGGLAATALGLPVAMLMGSLIAVAVAAAGGMRIGGHPVGVPQPWRFALVPVIGVAIGAGFTPAVLEQAGLWAVSIAALVIYLPAAHLAGYLVYRRGGLDRTTSYYGSVPGGLIESIQLGEAAGADVPMLTVLQFLRLILCIVMVPIAFSVIEGHAVGSGAGLGLPGTDVPLSGHDALVLLAVAGVGVAGGRLLRLPAAVISGPILASAAAHVAGLTEAAPPGWLILVTQWVVGTSLGARFAGMRPRMLRTALLLALVNAAIALPLALAAALLLAPLTGQPVSARFLAYAPGGIAEMSLVALSLGVSAVFVTAHHIVRLLLAVLMAQAGTRLL